MFKRKLQIMLENSWQQPNVLTVLLWPWSQIYRLLTLCRTQAYERGWASSYRSPVPVIVVGNITVGGTGKTPLVIHLVERLREHGYRPGVISRGYGGMAEQYPLAVNATTSPAACGDEPALIARRTKVPVMVGADRKASIEKLLREHEIDVVISDDGMQHLAMQRDVEICVQDASRYAANSLLLPAGPYREPLSRMRSVDFLISHGDDGADEAIRMRLQPAAIRSLSNRPPGDFDGNNGVHAVAAIGDPERFFKTCEAQGWAIERHAFPDHYRFTAEDLDFDDDRPVIMTEKDAVKCIHFADHRHWVLPVDAKLSPDLIPQLLARLERND